MKTLKRLRLTRPPFVQGIPEIQSILLRDMRRRGLTRKAVQKCRQRQNMRMNELDQKKKELQEKLRDALRVSVACSVFCGPCFSSLILVLVGFLVLFQISY